MISELGLKFPDVAARAKVPRRARIVIDVGKDDILKVASYLKEGLGFDCVVSVCGVDFPRGNSFIVVYHIWSTSKKVLLEMRARIPRDDPVISSITPIFESANWHERETHEMFGIKFEGHPNLGRLLLPEDWDKMPPLRKDFPHEAPPTRGASNP